MTDAMEGHDTDEPFAFIDRRVAGGGDFLAPEEGVYWTPRFTRPV